MTDKAHRIVQFAQERIDLLKKMAEIDKELDSQRLTLLTLLTQIAIEQAKPLTLVNFVWLAWKAGYVTQAMCFSGLIYAAIRKLISLGVLERDQECQGYRYINRAAP